MKKLLELELRALPFYELILMHRATGGVRPNIITLQMYYRYKLARKHAIWSVLAQYPDCFSLKDLDIIFTAIEKGDNALLYPYFLPPIGRTPFYDPSPHQGIAMWREKRLQSVQNDGGRVVFNIRDYHRSLQKYYDHDKECQILKQQSTGLK